MIKRMIKLIKHRKRMKELEAKIDYCVEKCKENIENEKEYIKWANRSIGYIREEFDEVFSFNENL